MNSKIVLKPEDIFTDINGTLDVMSGLLKDGAMPTPAQFREMVSHLNICFFELIQSANYYDFLECAREGHKFVNGKCEREWCSQVCQDCDGKLEVEMDTPTNDGDMDQYMSPCQCVANGLEK